VSPLSSILLAIQTSLAAWCADTTPVKGEVQIAADALEGYAALQDAPRGYRVVLWWAGDKPVSGNNDAFVGSVVQVGIAIAKGLQKDPRAELLTGTAQRDIPVLDIIEGITATMRGMYTGTMPTKQADSCWLLRYTGGSEWIKYEVAVEHYVHQLNFILNRELPSRQPLAVTLS
jgi:hypothetical protein